MSARIAIVKTLKTVSYDTAVFYSDIGKLPISSRRWLRWWLRKRVVRRLLWGHVRMEYRWPSPGCYCCCCCCCIWLHGSESDFTSTSLQIVSRVPVTSTPRNADAINSHGVPTSAWQAKVFWCAAHPASPP